MRPLVIDLDALVSPSRMASRAELLRLRELVIQRHGGVQLWRSALDGS
ncbi:MAG: hypothetical protein K1X94_23855 [Sandaracinaceae bacterium]|nr:hypothetical protein [Sandaracinaceae bacterium]